MITHVTNLRKRYYNLPNGEPTVRPRQYQKAWKDLIKPICEAAGLRLGAYDPDFQLVNDAIGHTCSIPVWLAEKLNKALTTA